MKYLKISLMILIKLIMILTTVNTHILQQVIYQLHKLPYNEVNTLIDSLNYDLQHHTFDDETETEERQPIGFQTNNNDNTDEDEGGDDDD